MIYQPEFADQARAMCRLGATDEELAEHFGACVRTIYRWRNTHEEFASAVVAGKDHADARVERALYSRAIGCTVERTRVFRSAGEDPVYATYRHQLPPDAAAALHWLRVRQPDKWRIRDEEESDTDLARDIEEAWARVEACRHLEEESAGRAAEVGRSGATPQQPEQPASPPPEPAAPDPDPEPDLDMRTEDDPAPHPCPCPEEEAHPAPAAEPPPPPPPAPKTVMRPCDFARSNRGPDGYGWPRPDPGG